MLLKSPKKINHFLQKSVPKMASAYSNSSLIFISICCAVFFLLNGQMAMAQSADSSNDGASSASSNSSQPIILPPTMGFCPPGEVLLNCSMPPGCEPTCEQPEPSQYCVQICPVARCHCVLGHVRSPSGNCIPYEQCPCRDRPEPQCDAGYNQRGECKCRCGINERCHLVRNSTGDCGCPEKKCGGESQERDDDEQWECVSVLRCGEYDCIPGVERCQISNATLRPECVPINSTPGSMTSSSTATSATSATISTTSEKITISSTPIDTTSEAPTPSEPSSNTPNSPLMTSATTKAPEVSCTLPCPYGQRCCIENGEMICK